MKSILNYLRDYIINVDKRMLVICILLAAVGIFLNYHFKLNRKINSSPGEIKYIYWYLIFLIAFALPYLIYSFSKESHLFSTINFVTILLLAPAIFAWKMAFDINIHFSNSYEWNAYLNLVVYWPLKLLVITFILFVIWKKYDLNQAFYGTVSPGFKIAPYLLMLCIMVPLIAAASTQPDFLVVYPKLKNLHNIPSGHINGLYKLAYELSYGSDFITIELFFRGFLILGFMKYAGKECILPMAVFYCVIHFGKPVGECISSFFGGILLGVITYNTRTVWGGVIVHLGIAWMMELGGYLGNLYY